jgi:hypothetical protein
MSFERVPAYRIASESSINLGTNALARLVPGGIESYLREITMSDEFLRYAYVNQRHSPEDGGSMDLADPGQFGPNVFAERTKDDWRATDRVSASRNSIRQLVPDEAEFSLIDWILAISQSLDADIYAEGQLSGIGHGTTRLSFIQGGIGCGKTTMLRHLIQLTVPDLQSKGVLPPTLPIAYYDLNNSELENDDIEPHWNRILKSFQEQLGEKTGLQDSDGWKRIAQDDIYDSTGQTRPAVEYSPTPDESIRAIIGKSSDPEIFLKRIARYLWKSATPRPVIFVLDNLDWIPDRDTHLRFARKVSALLEQIPSALGIITVREYTLGKMEEAVNEFAAFYHVNRLHITTPVVGEVVRRRLARAIDSISDEGARDTSVEIRNQVTVTPADCKALLHHIIEAFEPEIPTTPDRARNSTMADLEGSMARLSVFLYNVTNSNVRAALQIVSAALSSWALTHDRFVEQYLKQRQHGPIRLTPFTVDELVRLASIGPRLHYDATQCGLFHNVFATDHRGPDRAGGFAPALHLYRVLQCINHYDCVTPRLVIEKLECLAPLRAENLSILEMLQERGFIESRAGLEIELDKAFYPTRKLRFYLRLFSSSLVYLSMVRNDCHLEYQARPWDFHDELVENCHEALKFIEYVLDQEIVQYDYSKKVGRTDKFRWIAGDWPVSWRLLRSLGSFLTKRERISLKDWGEIQPRIAELESLIRTQIAGGKVYGNIAGS